MGLAGAGRAEHDHVLRVLDEVEGFEGLPPVVDGEAQGCPVVAVELLGLGEPGLFEQPRAFGAFPGFDLGVHPRVHEPPSARAWPSPIVRPIPGGSGGAGGRAP